MLLANVVVSRKIINEKKGFIELYTCLLQIIQIELFFKT